MQHRRQRTDHVSEAVRQHLPNRYRLCSHLQFTPLAITVHSVVEPCGKLRGKGRCGVFTGKTVWSTPERLRGEVLTTRRYKSTFTFTFSWLQLHHNASSHDTGWRTAISTRTSRGLIHTRTCILGSHLTSYFSTLTSSYIQNTRFIGLSTGITVKEAGFV